MNQQHKLPPNFEPMLAVNQEYDFPSDLPLPCVVSPKYDGIRVMQVGERWCSKTFTDIPNRQAVAYLNATVPVKFVDAELMVCDESAKAMPYNTTQKYFSRANDKLPAGLGWRVKVFDSFYAPRESFSVRRLMLESQLDDELVHGLLAPVHLCTTYEQLTEWCELYSQHYEGAVVRNPQGVYKYGRCTVAERNVFKYVKLVREEGKIVGYTENEMHKDRIGALLVDTENWGELKVGTGFDLKLSREFLRGEHAGRIITYEYKPFGMKDKPRQPAFVGFRDGGV